MSRRHNSSRRRSYGRRQHEVRERRPGAIDHGDWRADATAATSADDWQIAEIEEDRPQRGTTDGYGGAQL